MAELSFEIEDNLLEDLKVRAITIESSFEDLIVKYIEQGLKGRNFMSTVNLEENVMEKVNIKCRLSNKTPDEVVNDVLWENLAKLEDVSDFDAEKILSMLDHDKPEGDDILDRITDMFD